MIMSLKQWEKARKEKTGPQHINVLSLERLTLKNDCISRTYKKQIGSLRCYFGDGN